MRFRLYLIGDRKIFPNEELFLEAVERALSAGIRAFQLREKDLTVKEFYRLAHKFREITRRNDALLFVNDRVDVALAVQADGVHLPQSGIPAKVVRKVWGDRLLIGVSTHSLEEAKEVEDFADFITFSPIFQTTSKTGFTEPQGLEKLREIKDKVKCKVFALGGINLSNARQVLPYSDGLAMISGILAQTNIEETVKKFKEIIGEEL